METSSRQSQKTDPGPGTLAAVGELKYRGASVTVYSYGEGFYREESPGSSEELRKFLKDSAPIIWVHLEGLSKTDILLEIGNFFDLHELTLEDIINTGLRPKQVNYDSYTHIIIRDLSFNQGDFRIEEEQINLLVGEGYVITATEGEASRLKGLRKRIEVQTSTYRKRGADYLAYSLLDLVVDNYFSVLEKVGEALESLEEDLLENPGEKALQRVHMLKREMLGMRQAVWPLREALIGLEQSEAVFVQADLALHLRDVYSHTVQIIDTIEIYREILSGMVEIYLSSINNKLNEVMKLLTIFAAIFIPLTLISGIYGMNFQYMPELDWLYGYPFALGLMVAVAAGMLFYFKRKKWF